MRESTDLWNPEYRIGKAEFSVDPPPGHAGNADLVTKVLVLDREVVLHEFPTADQRQMAVHRDKDAHVVDLSFSG